ncbi:LppX_LprAFG lipoprotein [Actinocorallia sp. A-T 12471]|uniref:LppX_LprAFG lipoprotein n=1 Tax=Actinocorallia sp. A-T 12471 TaxID=3089813 RepID=UPI0029D081AC|nr:LppX_LprAFG lipoprotein [Actinocorallia sp. A-T 12471]MDX6738274.1 LppX_LprAFG lipoprotein [Actinocorallia sp. A-T 12471]
MRQRVVGVVAGMGLLLGAVGCADDGAVKVEPPGTVAATAGAPVPTLPGTPGATPPPVTTSAPAQGTPAAALRAAAERAGQITAYAMEVRVDGQEKVTGTGSFQVRPTPASSVEMTTVGAGTAKLIVIGDTVYMSSPGAEASYGGKKWLKVTPQDAASGSGADPEDLKSQFDQTDPAKLAALYALSTDAVVVGAEDVGGVATTHYRGTVDAAAVTDPALKPMAQQLAGGAPKIAFDLWTDAEGLPRKAVSTVTGSAPMTTTVVFRDYGKPVTVSPPPASEVADFGQP